MIGGRPEFVIAWESPFGFRHGVGAYGEIADAHDHLVVGGGLTYVRYLGWIGVAPSIGLYHRTTGSSERDNGVSAGVFVGFRHPEVIDDVTPYGLDIPFGLRVDAHLGFGGARDVLISAQLDTASVIAGIIVLYGALTHDWN